MKPNLASDFVEAKLKFPLVAQPKIDGVRALNGEGSFTGRSLKPFKNIYIGSYFGRPTLAGLDGELAGERENHPDLCRITSSLTGTIKGEPWLLWHLFDLITPDTHNLPYLRRMDLLEEKVERIKQEEPDLGSHLKLIPYLIVGTMDQLLEYENECLSHGYEGVCIRRPGSKHKQGRSTPTEGGLLRIKRFIDFEFEIKDIVEGEHNGNPAKTNELGQTERSTHQDFMQPNGMIGALLGATTSVVKHDGKVLFEKGQEVRVSAGCLKHDERKYYFENPDKILGRIGKAKLFPKGIKDKPRFPTFQSFRDKVDIS